MMSRLLGLIFGDVWYDVSAIDRLISMTMILLAALIFGGIGISLSVSYFLCGC